MIARLHEVVGAEHRAALRRFLLAVVVAAIAEGLAFALAAPLLVALLDGRTADAARWLIPVAAVAVVGWLAYYDTEVRGMHLGVDWRRTLYARIGDHLGRLPLGWFDPATTGRVDVLLGRDVPSIVSCTAMARSLVAAVLTPATILAALALTDRRIALCVLVAVPLVLLGLRLSRAATTSADAAEAAAAREASSRIVEFAGAQPILRSSGRDRDELGVLGDALDAQHRTARRSIISMLPGLHLGQLIIQLAFTAVLFGGALLATGTAIDAPRLIVAIVLAMQCIQPFAELALAAPQLRAARATLERLHELLDTQPLPEPMHPGTPADASIEFEDVGFGYGATPVLAGVSLRVPAGSMTALVGASGAGKTTVARLVARFWDVDAGSVRIGGVDVRELGTQDLMTRLALVFQDVYLFDTTLIANIRIGRPGASDEEVLAAATLARVDQIAERLPDGWQSRVGEGGSLLSGGERQRVSIARAMLKEAPIVLLDEATSALDPENEAAINAALRALGQRRTLLVIAHRLSTIRAADQIAVLDGGRVVELGDHDALLEAGGRYARLWRERSNAQGWRLAGTTS